MLIITPDAALVETLGGKLREWGAAVYHQAHEYASPEPQRMIDVVLVDIRQHPDAALQRLSSVIGAMPLAETILINNSNNISGSMAGMRAGASDELNVPFDTETLKKVVGAACDRSQTRKKKKKRRSLFDVIGDTMNAATFAQAGEFETALDLLNNPTAEESPDNRTGKKKAPKTR